MIKEFIGALVAYWILSSTIVVAVAMILACFTSLRLEDKSCIVITLHTLHIKSKPYLLKSTNESTISLNFMICGQEHSCKYYTPSYKSPNLCH